MKSVEVGSINGSAGKHRAISAMSATGRNRRRGQRFPHFLSVTLRPRKDGRNQQEAQSIDFSLAGMKVRIEGERLPGKVFRIFLPDEEPPSVCGVGEIRWERRMPNACEVGLAFRTTTDDYRDLIRRLRENRRQRALARLQPN